MSVEEFCTYLAKTWFRAAIALHRRCTYVQHDVCCMLCLAMPTMTQALSHLFATPSQPSTHGKAMYHRPACCSAAIAKKKKKCRMTYECISDLLEKTLRSGETGSKFVNLQCILSSIRVKHPNRSVYSAPVNSNGTRSFAS